jgi:hypothetical protein
MMKSSTERPYSRSAEGDYICLICSVKFYTEDIGAKVNEDITAIMSNYLAHFARCHFESFKEKASLPIPDRFQGMIVSRTDWETEYHVEAIEYNRLEERLNQLASVGFNIYNIEYTAGSLVFVISHRSWKPIPVELDGQALAEKYGLNFYVQEMPAEESEGKKGTKPMLFGMVVEVGSEIRRIAKVGEIELWRALKKAHGNL